MIMSRTVACFPSHAMPLVVQLMSLSKTSCMGVAKGKATPCLKRRLA